jgi:DHA1 family multidrug resistance protein-like MFS transporter
VNWRRNLFAVTAASFIGFTGFTLVMPFLPLYFQQLGVSDVGDIAMWSGLSLGVTPAVTAILSPFWGRLADRYGLKIMVERSLVSFIFVMGLMAYVKHPWQVLALRALQGVFAGYGSLTLTMAADSAPREQTAYAIGFVQTAQRLGPAAGPVIGGTIAQLVGLRDAFLVTAAFYLCAVVVVFFMYDERRAPHMAHRPGRERVTFRNVLAFENFVLLMGVVFGLQFIDRSFGPVLPLHVAALGTAQEQVPIVAGVLFSIMAAAGAIGHHMCGKLLRRATARHVIVASAAIASAGALVYVVAGSAWLLVLGTPVFGLGIGIGMTATYTAANSVLPDNARATGFGLLSTGSLAGIALSPMINGIIAVRSIRTVFVLDTAALLAVCALVSRMMIAAPLDAPTAPATEEL